MLNRASDQVLASCARLYPSHDFQTFINYLMSELEEADKLNRGLSNEALYRCQGKAQTLAAIIEEVQNAVKNMRSRESSRAS